MAGAADPLEAARDRLRRLDLDHEVDGAHVDPELERRGGDEARDLALLQELLHLDPLLAGERAVVGAGDLFLRELVEAQREPLGEAAVVDEDDRRAVRPDELEQRRVDRPDGRPDRVALARLAHVVDADDELAHVVDRHDDLEVELLGAASTTLDLAGRRPRRSGDLLERPLGGRETDALHRPADEALEPLEAEREVGAALRARDGVHLVDDHVRGRS